VTVVLTYTLSGAAAVTGLSVDYIRRAIKATDPDLHLPARMAGTKYLIRRDDLEAWIDRLPEA
jgi:excisionase family DNA binding protein